MKWALVGPTRPRGARLKRYAQDCHYSFGRSSFLLLPALARGPRLQRCEGASFLPAAEFSPVRECPSVAVKIPIYFGTASHLELLSRLSPSVSDCYAQVCGSEVYG